MKIRTLSLILSCLFYFPLLIQAQIVPGSADNFITVWNTMNSESITIPTQGEGYNYELYWEQLDNPDNNGVMSDLSGTATVPGLANNTTYRIEIVGDFPRIYMVDSENPWKLSEIVQWGSIQWSSMEDAFLGSALMDITAEDVPDLSGVETMRNMFKGCEFLNGNQANWEWTTDNVRDMSGVFKLAWNFNQDISSWEVGNVTDMAYMFYGEDDPFGFPRFSRFNQDISSWDVSNVENMRSMFFQATYFNQDLSGWDVSKATNLSGMFSGASSFNSDLSEWEVSKVTNMSGMFDGAAAFFSDISSWDVSKVTNMAGMFRGARLFNSDISGWDVSRVTNMAYMFSSTLIFNRDISVWDIGNVTDMSGMFSYAVTFNQDISVWDIGHVSSLRGMFSGAESFNQDIGNWDVSNADNMAFMFSNAYSFNQDISGWDVSNVSDFWMMFNNAFSFNQNLAEWDISKASNMRSMFNNSGMQCENYSATLMGWASQENAPFGIQLGAVGMEFAPVTDQYRKDILIDLKGWEIDGDEEGDCELVSVNDFQENEFLIELYPNPARDFIYLRSKVQIDAVDISVYDALGKKVAAYLPNFSQDQSIDISQWKSGLYFIRWVHGNSIHTTRFLKQ